MRLAGIVLGVAACGRLGFDPTTSRDGGSDSGDAIVAAPFSDVVGGPNSRLRDIAPMPDGSVAVIGLADGDAVVGGISLPALGGGDVIVAVIQADGTARWAQRFGGPGEESGRGIATAPDGTIYITGTFAEPMTVGGAILVNQNTDAFVASYTADGAYRWSLRVGGNAPDGTYGSDNGDDVAVAPNGDIVVSGNVAGAVDFGDGMLVAGSATATYEAFAARYTRDGSLLWARRWGDTRLNDALGVTVDAADEIYLTGFYEGTPDLGGGPVPYRGIQDAFVIALTSTGAYRWAQTFGGSDFDYAIGAVVVDGTVIVSGFYETSIDLPGVPVSQGLRDGLIAGFSTTGAFQWQVAFGTPGCDRVHYVRATSGGALFAADVAGPSMIGGIPVTSNGGLDVMVGLVSSSGVIESATTFGTPADDRSFAVIGDIAHAFVVGITDSSVANADPCAETGGEGFVRHL